MSHSNSSSSSQTPSSSLSFRHSPKNPQEQEQQRNGASSGNRRHSHRPYDVTEEQEVLFSTYSSLASLGAVETASQSGTPVALSARRTSAPPNMSASSFTGHPFFEGPQQAAVAATYDADDDSPVLRRRHERDDDIDSDSEAPTLGAAPAAMARMYTDDTDDDQDAADRQTTSAMETTTESPQVSVVVARSSEESTDRSTSLATRPTPPKAGSNGCKSVPSSVPSSAGSEGSNHSKSASVPSHGNSPQSQSEAPQQQAADREDVSDPEGIAISAPCNTLPTPVTHFAQLRGKVTFIPFPKCFFQAESTSAESSTSSSNNSSTRRGRRRAKDQYLNQKSAILSTAGEVFKTVVKPSSVVVSSAAATAPVSAQPADAVTRAFFGQLPYHVTEMQLTWICAAFGGEISAPQRIMKANAHGERMPTGGVHLQTDEASFAHWLTFMNKRVLIDEGGAWFASNAAEKAALDAFIGELKARKELRPAGRPYDTIVVQRALSTYVPKKPVRFDASI